MSIYYDPTIVLPGPVTAALPPPVIHLRSRDELDADLAHGGVGQLVVLGPACPVGHAVELILLLTSTSPATRVVVLRDHLDVGEMQQLVRAGARDVVEAVDLAGLQAACRPTVAQPSVPAPNAAVPRVPGRIVTVFSAKGGAGKTTVATNLAAALNAGGTVAVCLVDLDLQFGDVAIMMQLQPGVSMADVVGVADADIDAVAGLLAAAGPGLDCLLAPVAPGQSDSIDAALTSAVLEQLRMRYEYVVVDTPSQFNEHVLAALDLSDHHVLIAAPELPSLKNLRLTLDMLDLLGYSHDRRSIVLNRADSSAGLTMSDVNRIVKSPIVVQIPSSRDVVASINRGVPLTRQAPDHPVSLAIRRLAAERLGSGAIPTGRHRPLVSTGWKKWRS